MNIVIQYNKRQVGIILVLLIAVGTGFILFRRTPTDKPATPPPSATPLPQSSAAVTDSIDVDIQHLPIAADGKHTIQIALNTHAGDLSIFDAMTNVTYQTSGGASRQPINIGGDRETHHRTLTVTFTDAPLPGTLIIKNLGSIPERTFTIQ